jgi:hypothetical protein
MQLVRTLSFRFRPCFARSAEPLLRHWLEADVRDEVRLAKDHLERDHRG